MIRGSNLIEECRKGFTNSERKWYDYFTNENGRNNI